MRRRATPSSLPSATLVAACRAARRRRRPPPSPADHHRRRSQLDGHRRPGRRPTSCLVDSDLYVPAGVTAADARARRPDHQRLRRLQGRPGRRRAGVRPRGLRHAVLHRARLPRTAAARSRWTTPTTTARRPSSSSTTSAGRKADNAGRHVARHWSRTTARRRPEGRHGRRLVRRPGAVRGRLARPAGRRADPDHHLERPVLLAGPEQHRASAPAGTASPTAPPACTRRQWTSLFFAHRHHRRHPGRRHRPDPQRRLPELRRPGLRGQGAARRARLPDPGDDRLRPARLRVVVPAEGDGTDPARAGPEGHAVQPAGGGRDLPRAAGAGHAGADDLAVLGPQPRRHAGTRRARPDRRRPAALDATSAAASSTGSTATSRATPRSSTGPEFAYFRDWVDLLRHRDAGLRQRRRRSRSARPSDALPVRRRRTSSPLARRCRPAAQTWANAAGRRADQLLARRRSQGGQATDPLPPTDAPGTFASWTSAPLSGADGARSASPTLDVTPDLAGGRGDPGGRPGRPAASSSPRSTTSRRTAPRRCTTGWSRRCGSPTSPSGCTSSCPASSSAIEAGPPAAASCWRPATRRTPATPPCCRSRSPPTRSSPAVLRLPVLRPAGA